MVRTLVIAFTLIACSGPAAQITTTQPAVETSTTHPIDLELQIDRWNGEVEWAMIEECALYGLGDCVTTVESLKTGGCSVEGARALLEARSGTNSATPRAVIERLHSQGDCAGLDSP